MTTTTVPTGISRFAEQVRDELADLSADDLDDLTDGLEADLAESLEEDPTRQLADPGAYAIELRTAAGLPPQAEPGRGVRGAIHGMTSGLRATGHQVAESLRGHPVTAGMLSFLEAVRPVWWVLRAWVAYQLIAAFFGSEGPVLPDEVEEWLVLLVLIVVSVQWGRGHWRNVWGMTPMIILGNVVAAVALLPLFAATNAWSTPYEVSRPYVEESSLGVTLDGHPISNIYAYDADGKPLSDVQLFDQDGNPLVPFHDPNCPDLSCNGNDVLLEPQDARLETGEGVRNVFPLSMQRMVLSENGERVLDPEQKEARVPKPPFVVVPKVAQGND